MNEDQTSPVTCADEGEPEASEHRNEKRSRNVGVGVGFLVAGVIVLTNSLGWTNIGWFLPAILIGYGAYYLFSAFDSPEPSVAGRSNPPS